MKKSSTVSSRTLVALWALLAALLVAGAALLIAPPQGYADDPTTVTTGETADCTITVMKVLQDADGNDLDIPDGEFKFELYNPQNEKVATATANDKGFAKFELKDLTEADSGEYTVKEVQDKKSKYTYDSDQKVTVTVGDLTTYGNTMTNAQNVETGNSEAMQHYKLYAGAGETTTYTHGSVIAGDGVSFKMITDADGNSYHAFCMVRHLSASEKDGPDRARWKGDADNGNGSGGTWLDAARQLNNEWNSENGAPDNNTYASGLMTIMWNGYPHNASGFMEQYNLSKEEFYQVTQHVIYAFGRYGGEYKNVSDAPAAFQSNTFRTKAASTELFDKLYNAACIAGQGWLDGVSLSVPYVEGDQVSALYVHWSGTSNQPLLSSWVKGTPTTKFQAIATSATFTNKEVASGEDNVTVKISKTDMNGTEVEGAHIAVKDSAGETVDEWDSTKETHELSVAPGDYTLTETAAPTGYQQITTEIKFTVAADGAVSVSDTTVQPAGAVEVVDGVLVLKNAIDENGEEPSSTEPSIGTTIKVDGLQATPGTVRRVENGGSYPVVDTVAYTNFEAGSYTVEGKLIKVVDGKDAGVVAQGSSSNVEAKTAEGEWEIDFGQVELEDNAAYVAFETVKDADGNEVAKHEDISDMPQVVVSGEGWTEIWEDEPNFTPAKPTDPTEPTEPTKPTSQTNKPAAAASSTAKTADTAGLATLAALLVAVAAAGVGITARRKSEK